MILAEGTRNKLIDSAGQIFAENGFKGTTIREICAQAGVNIALVNYYFGDKEKLYEAVLKQSFGSMEPEMRALESGLPPEQALREVVMAMARRVYRPGRPSWHFQLVTHEMAQPTAALERVIDESMRPMYMRFRALIGDLLGLGIDEDKTRLCAHSVMSQIIHYVQGKHFNKKIWPELEMTPERIEQIGTHIADFSLAYLCLPNGAAAPVKKKVVRRKK